MTRNYPLWQGRQFPKTRPAAGHQLGRRAQRGFTLTELMISVGIISILGAFALPAYRDYVATSERGVLISNMATIEVFQEDFRLRTGAYAVDLADKAGITAVIGWDPQDDGTITYAIAAGDGTTYRFSATSDGETVCLIFPAKTPCP
ncbi:MAG: prepilin-type N-terminal cleavage/methylation domain-containing protein [Pseudomonadota bacterium]